MPDKKEITIYDIARKLNISAATVSRGLKNHPAIKLQTRKTIAHTAKELGYRNNNFASSLRTKKTNTIGVIVPRLNSYFVASVLSGMEDEASREGYNLVIVQSLEKSEKEILNAHTMFNNRVDGLLVSLSYDTKNLNHFSPFFKKEIPIVFFDRVLEHTNSTNVVIDNLAAGYAITRHLLEQGCKRFMHLGGNMLRNVYADRFAGCLKALKEKHISFDKKLLYISDLSENAGTQAAELILAMPLNKRPDAVFAANDTAAVHCMIRLKAAGISIPADIAFAGFNNDPISNVAEPGLSTVNYSGYTMGVTAAAKLIGHLKGNSNIHATNSIVLRADLVIRGSSLKSKKK
jgi:LacI family transcriptional regulator